MPQLLIAHPEMNAEFETLILPIVVQDEPDAKIVRLKIDHQSFNIGEYYEDLEQAEFIANNLTIALNRLIESKLNKQAEQLEALREAAQDFVDKVERGEARSKRSYAKFKAALALLTGGMNEQN